MVRSDDGTSGGGRPMTYLHKTYLHNTCLYNGYDIESFEAGRGLWHARIRRVDQKPLIISGHPFPSLEVGFAWPDQDAAIADAKNHIDRFGHRWGGPEQIRASAA
jgi:hypothetical protein